VHDVQQPLRCWTPDNIAKYITEELLDIAAQYATNEEATGPHPTLDGREVVLDSGPAVPSGIVGQWVAAAGDYDDDDNNKVDGCDKQCVTIVSYPVFILKPSTHRMHDPGSIVPHIRPKVFTDNQMSRIKYNYYYINSVSKDYNDSQWNRTAEDSITPQE
jgi:hypothetical protein